MGDYDSTIIRGISLPPERFVLCPRIPAQFSLRWWLVMLEDALYCLTRVRGGLQNCLTAVTDGILQGRFIDLLVKIRPEERASPYDGLVSFWVENYLDYGNSESWPCTRCCLIHTSEGIV